MNEDTALRVVTALVQRQIGLFAAFAGQDVDEVVAVVLLGVREAWPSYDPAYAQSTFITNVAQRRIADHFRKLSRLAAREGRAAEMAPTATAARGMALVEWDHDLPMDEWLAGVYAAARRTITKRQRQGRRYYNFAQVVGVAALMYRLNLSVRGCRDMLADRPELAAALRFRHVPSHGWFQGAKKVCTHFAENFGQRGDRLRGDRETAIPA